MTIHKELFNLHKDLVFKDLTHTYTKNKVNYISVTTFLKGLTEFRKDYWLLYKSLEYLGYDVKSDASKGVKKDYIQVDGEIHKAINYLEQASYHIDLEKIILNMKLSWANIARIGVTRGSAMHDYNENLWRGKKMHNEFDNKFEQSHTGVDEYEYKMSIYKLRMFSDNFYNDHKEYLIPISLEQVVSDDELLIAGQIDCLFFDLRDNEYYLYDYKTDKKIETSNYFGKFKKLNLDDCNYNKYSLQVYLYKYILEKHTSIRIKDCKIVWLNKDQNNYKIYNLKNVSSEVEYLIEERKKQLNNDDKPAYIES